MLKQMDIFGEKYKLIILFSNNKMTGDRLVNCWYEWNYYETDQTEHKSKNTSFFTEALDKFVVYTVVFL